MNQMQMLPRMAMDQTPNGAFVHVESLGEFRLSVRAVGNEAEDFLGLFLCQFRVVVRLAVVVRVALFRASVFLDAVAHVVERCAAKQMARITAHAIVAAMTDMMASWHRAIGQLVRSPMGADILDAFSTWMWPRKTAVALLIDVTCPRPTVIWSALLDTAPQSFNERLSCVDSVRHSRKYSIR